MRVSSDTARRTAVLDVGRRWGWHEAHARQVSRLAVGLFDQAQPQHGLNDADRELLEFGALLHDVGEHVSVDAHHKHTAYLIEHSNLPDFSPDEISVLACLGRFHFRGDLKSSYQPYGVMDRAGRDRVTALVAMLRLADGLDHTRRGVVDAMTFDAGRDARLVVVGDGDPDLVASCAMRKAQLFEDVFDCRLEIDVSRQERLAVG
ncbi:MAG: HD domain-containing protein [Actinobacteria bacterium]|nr:HD domain-containing protein [Actinomycetota bacterium]MBV9662641.1 HD domain-containing protein [Actinomycetota bacterium]